MLVCTNGNQSSSAHPNWYGRCRLSDRALDGGCSCDAVPKYKKGWIEDWRVCTHAEVVDVDAVVSDGLGVAAVMELVSCPGRNVALH